MNKCRHLSLSSCLSLSLSLSLPPTLPPPCLRLCLCSSATSSAVASVVILVAVAGRNACPYIARLCLNSFQFAWPLVSAADSATCERRKNIAARELSSNAKRVLRRVARGRLGMGGYAIRLSWYRVLLHACRRTFLRLFKWFSLFASYKFVSQQLRHTWVGSQVAATWHKPRFEYSEIYSSAVLKLRALPNSLSCAEQLLQLC